MEKKVIKNFEMKESVKKIRLFSGSGSGSSTSGSGSGSYCNFSTTPVFSLEYD